MIDKVVEEVTARVRERSAPHRSAYLDLIDRQAEAGPSRTNLPCSNLAHGIAACSTNDKQKLTTEATSNLAIVTAYNDMLSAHQPYEDYPKLIRNIAEQCGAVAQVAGGVPAMCDGVTQGQAGMELSLFSRDLIAMSTAIALSHNMFDAAVYLGVCDKIVPGLLIGALSFGHLPGVFIPAGPMESGLPNKEKASVREAYARGEVDKVQLIAAESASYHSAGTCTFYGTANSNQMLMEFMGLQLPGSSFVNPSDPMRNLFTDKAVREVLERTYQTTNYQPLGRIVDECAIINGIVGLLATGGSTNHTIHLVAIAGAAGILIDWQDIADLSSVIPLLAQVYPNGQADVNQFHQAGGLACVVSELIDAGLMHEDTNTVVGRGMSSYAKSATECEGEIKWSDSVTRSLDHTIVRPVSDPFRTEGGIQVVEGEVGRAIVKVSAVDVEYHYIRAPARVFSSQGDFAKAFEDGLLNENMVVVLKGQGPKANGMPELHQLSPYLGSMQSSGLRVALLTDGRMSGASGKVLSAIQLTPEAASGGPIGKIRDGDLITIDVAKGSIDIEADLTARDTGCDELDGVSGMGRELFGVFRRHVTNAESGGTIFR